MFGKLFSSIYEAIPSAVEKDRVQTLVTNQDKRYKESLVKAFELQDSWFAKTPIYQDLDKRLKRNDGYKGNPIDYMRKIVEKRVKEKDLILEAVEAAFGNKVYKEAIDYNCIQLLSYIAVCDWFAEAALAFLVTALNQATYENDNPYREPSHKESANFINSSVNQQTLASVCNALFGNFKEANAKIKQLDGIAFEPTGLETMKKQYGAGTVDPMQVGFIPVSINPVYLLGTVYNNWFVETFKEDKEKVAELKLKIYRLEREKAGATAEEIAQIDEQIAYHADRISELNERIERVNRSAR